MRTRAPENEAGRKTRLEDVARLAEVSRPVAARVLTGGCRTVRVGAEKAEQIRRIARELGFVPDRTAQALRGAPTRTIGLITGDLFHLPLSNMWEAIDALTKELRAHGYRALMGACARQTNLPREFVAEMTAYHVDGMALLSLDEADMEDLARGLSAGTPAVAFSECAWFQGDQVTLDRVAGVAALAAYCIAQGHRRFAFASPSRLSGRAKLAGLVGALGEHGLPWEAGWEIEATDEPGGEAELARRIVSAPWRPTCALATNDTIAVKIIRGLREIGLRAPKDLSVAGFDDLPCVTRFSDVPLTTLRQPRPEMGTVAARMLLERIGNPGLAPRQRVFAPELVVRESVGRVG